MPNLFAYAMLLVWPVVVALLFSRFGLRVALLAAILGGYLILPPKTGIDLPMLPTWNKDLAPALAALLMCLAVERRDPRAAEWRAAGWLPRSLIARLLLIVLVFSPVLTVLTNRDALVYGSEVLPAMRLYDSGAMLYGQIAMILPFLLARRYLADAEGREMLLRALVIGALAYVLPILLEIRLSPQLNNWIYGFHSFGFNTAVRDGSFRPTVFLQHGLRTTLFLAMAIVAAAGLWRFAWSGRSLWAAAAAGLGLVLTISSSLGAFVSAVLFAPIARLLGRGPRLAVAALVAAAALIYPILRGADLVPTEALVDLGRVVGNEERAASLQFRFENEDMLLRHANERPLFGWGIWSRGRIFDETGRDLSVTDGVWAIVFGSFGWTGYLAQFGLLTVPVLLLFARRRRIQPDETTAAVALVLSVNLIDMMPNSGLTPVTWLLAGATLGAAEARRVEVRRSAPAEPVKTPPRRVVIGAISERPPARAGAPVAGASAEGAGAAAGRRAQSSRATSSSATARR